MGRIAGVTTEQTEQRLIDAAAAVFARRGYDGASIAEITSEAGLSSGAVYSRFGSKAELFAATLRARSPREVERLLGDGSVDAADLLARRGAQLDARDPHDGDLLMEAMVAARRHPEVATLLAELFLEREGRLAELVRRSQAAGTLEPDSSPEAVARFVLMLALGSMLTATLALPATEPHEWSTLIDGLVDRFRTDLPTKASPR
jgi:AcrR family transcriptional regulator